MDKVDRAVLRFLEGSDWVPVRGVLVALMGGFAAHHLIEWNSARTRVRLTPEGQELAERTK